MYSQPLHNKSSCVRFTRTGVLLVPGGRCCFQFWNWRGGSVKLGCLPPFASSSNRTRCLMSNRPVPSRQENLPLPPRVVQPVPPKEGGPVDPPCHQGTGESQEPGTRDLRRWLHCGWGQSPPLFAWGLQLCFLLY